MYSQIDRILFPNWCEVYQIASHRYIYPIFKNASSLLKNKSKEHSWKILVNQQIKKIDVIEVYLRDPYERYISGLNSIIKWNRRDNPGIDEELLFNMYRKYEFLDRHYAPQYFWLCNLYKYFEGKVLVKNLSDINPIVDNEFHRPKRTPLPTEEFISKCEDVKENIFLKLDDIIINNFLEKQTDIYEINNFVKDNFVSLYKEIFENNLTLIKQHGLS